MGKFTFYLKAKPFIGQWLRHHYGEPVRFPAQSPENACINAFVRLRPKDWQPQQPDSDSVAVEIPYNKKKQWLSWNYMSKSACGALMEIIEGNFNTCLYNELTEMSRNGCTLLKCVRAWCENNGIDPDYDYTLKMRYQRMRNSHLSYGVDLRKKKRGNCKAFL